MLRGELISQYVAFLPSIEMKDLGFCHHTCLGGMVLPSPTPDCVPQLLDWMFRTAPPPRSQPPSRQGEHLGRL